MISSQHTVLLNHKMSKPITGSGDNKQVDTLSKKIAQLNPGAENSRVNNVCKVFSEISHNDWSDLEGKFSEDLASRDGSVAQRFLTAVSGLLTHHVTGQLTTPTAKVLDFHHPHQLQEAMGHCLGLHHDGRDLEQLLSDCRETLKFCVKTGHPQYLNQLSTGCDVVGVAGAWLASAANTNMFTYEAAPVFTLMERETLGRMRARIGWQDGDGIFAPGGAISNLYGILLARHRAMPKAKAEGVGQGKAAAQRWIILASEQGHYSVSRAALMLGIGTDNVVNVPCLENGQMSVAALEGILGRRSQAGDAVLAVVATAGTTVLGAVDPLPEVARLCDKHGVWMHVDAAWGGGILMSRKHCGLLEGISRADSVTWNPHKMMGVPLQCSAFLTKHKGLLSDCLSLKASYLFQQDKVYDVAWDTGDASVQCGRHNDVFKLWLMWRAKGDKGFEAQMDKLFSLATYVRDQIKEKDGFHLILEEFQAPNVCFYYLPRAWRNRTPSQIKPEILHKVAPIIKARMMEAGTLMVQYQPLGTKPNFFRIALSNPLITQNDLDLAIKTLDDLGADVPLPEDWE